MRDIVDTFDRLVPTGDLHTGDEATSEERATAVAGFALLRARPPPRSRARVLPRKPRDGRELAPSRARPRGVITNVARAPGRGALCARRPSMIVSSGAAPSPLLSVRFGRTFVQTPAPFVAVTSSLRHARERESLAHAAYWTLALVVSCARPSQRSHRVQRRSIRARHHRAAFPRAVPTCEVESFFMLCIFCLFPVLPQSPCTCHGDNDGELHGRSTTLRVVVLHCAGPPWCGSCMGGRELALTQDRAVCCSVPSPSLMMTN